MSKCTVAMFPSPAQPHLLTYLTKYQNWKHASVCTTFPDPGLHSLLAAWPGQKYEPEDGAVSREHICSLYAYSILSHVHTQT